MLSRAKCLFVMETATTPSGIELERDLSANEHTEGIFTVESEHRESSFNIDVDLGSAERGEERRETPPEDIQEAKDEEEPYALHLRPTGRVSTDEVDTRMSDSGSKGPLLCLGLVAASIASLLIVILVPLSFADLEYYEMGFAKRKSTGTVDRSKVYMGGRHFIGVDYTFKKFKADAHIEVFQKMEFFNKEKLSVTMTFALQYFLMPEELKSLHDSYDLGYRPILRNTVKAAIKDAATKYSVDEYRKERPKVSAGLFKAAKLSLGGTCCFSDCKKYICDPGCLRSNCTKGLYAYLKYFQLEEVDITEQQEQKFLQAVIEREKRDTENYKQREKVLRKETEFLKKKIENSALEVSQNATAKSTLIKAQADAAAKAVKENARNSGLQTIYGTVNITSEAHKKSLDYLRTLLNHKKTHMYVGFTTMVAKEGT